VNQSHYTTSHHNVRKCYKSIMLPGLLSTEIEVAQKEKYIHRSPKVIYTNMMQWELELLLNMPVVTGKLVNKASWPFSMTICIHIDGSTQHLFQGVNKTFDKMFLSMQELLWKHCMLKTEVNISHKFLKLLCKKSICTLSNPICTLDAHYFRCNKIDVQWTSMHITYLNP
jgi:hypothetical protein